MSTASDNNIPVVWAIRIAIRLIRSAGTRTTSTLLAFLHSNIRCRSLAPCLLNGVDARIQAAYEKQVTGKNVYQFLLDFDTLYEKMTDLEKKQFMRMFIESIEL